MPGKDAMMHRQNGGGNTKRWVAVQLKCMSNFHFICGKSHFLPNPCASLVQFRVSCTPGLPETVLESENGFFASSFQDSQIGQRAL